MLRRQFLAAAGLLVSGCATRPTSVTMTPDAGVVIATTTDEGHGTPRAPLVQWSFTLDQDAERATVTHEAGETLTTDRTDRLALVVTTAPDHPIPTDATLTPTRTPRVLRTTWLATGGDPYPIRPGDSATMEGVTPGDTMAVWWYGTESHREGTRLESVTFEKV